MIFACPTDDVVGHVFSKLREGALSQFKIDEINRRIVQLSNFVQRGIKLRILDENDYRVDELAQSESDVRVAYDRGSAYNGICRSVEGAVGPANQFSLSLLPPTGEQDKNIRLGISVPWFDLAECGFSSFDEMQKRLDDLVGHIQTVFE